MPPAPDNLRGTVTATHREGGATVREVRLQFGREHEVAVAFALGSESREDSPSDAEVSGAHMRAFFSAFQAQRDAAEIFRF